MTAVVVLGLIGLLLVAVTYYSAVLVKSHKKALRYAVTLKNNEGAFIALCIKRRWNTWVFVDIKIVPANPGAPVVQAAPGELYVPYRNILYYQEIQETANADK